jgi:hypothetical protein
MTPYVFPADDVCKHRPYAYRLMVGYAKRKRESKIRMDGLALLAQLEARVAKLRAKLIASCPHVFANQEYSETGREDEFGGHLRGADCEIRCKSCNKTLEKWRRE